MFIFLNVFIVAAPLFTRSILMSVSLRPSLPISLVCSGVLETTAMMGVAAVMLWHHNVAKKDLLSYLNPSLCCTTTSLLLLLYLNVSAHSPPKSCPFTVGWVLPNWYMTHSETSWWMMMTTSVEGRSGSFMHNCRHRHFPRSLWRQPPTVRGNCLLSADEGRWK